MVSKNKTTDASLMFAFVKLAQYAKIQTIFKFSMTNRYILYFLNIPLIKFMAAITFDVSINRSY